MIALKSDTLCPFYALDAVVSSYCSQRQHHPPVDTPTSMGGVSYYGVAFRCAVSAWARLTSGSIATGVKPS
jgi:hypothetical protein